MTIGAANVPVLGELTKAEYKDAVRNTEYWRYSQSADYHYFVSRVLFVQHVTEYGLFAGHQCVENYLKGYLKARGSLPENTHKLADLLGAARSLGLAADTFIHEKRASIIVAKYEPFYELARYPVQRSRPKGGYALIVPDDIFLLDYFVLRMREMLSIPTNTWDILSDGHFNLEMCKDNNPALYNLLFWNNINFPETK
jgi:HEPN domain-containing protein